MIDSKLDELIREVHRLERLYDECEPAALLPTILELRAAEERLNLYFKEQKKPLPPASKIGTKKNTLINYIIG